MTKTSMNRLAAVVSCAALTLSLTAVPAHADVEDDGTKYCRASMGESGPYATALGYGEVKVLGPGKSYYLVWWSDGWRQRTANGAGEGGYWRAVIGSNGGLDQGGTYASCYYQ